MHPNRSFGWNDLPAMLEFVSERGFAHIFASGSEAQLVVHAPVVITDTGRLQFHVARRNRALSEFAGKPVLISVAGADAYHSANWYASEDQVPTWLYQAVEIEGEARQLSEPELVAHLDRLTQVMEQRWSPEAPWTRAKMAPGKFEAMIQAIVGFEVNPATVRGTRKFNQHKSPTDVEASVQGQLSAGRADIAAAIHQAAGRK